MIKIFNEDCFITMDKLLKNDIKVDNIITSPFYNTGRGSKCHNSEKSLKNHEGRYDIHLDDMTNDEYIEFKKNYNKVFISFTFTIS